MRRVLRAGLMMLVGLVAAPAVAQAPGQWYVCAHTKVMKGGKTKRFKTNICAAHPDSAYYTAIARFTKAVYKGEVTAIPDYCRATHEACVP